MAVIQIVAALLRRAGKVLLVRQQESDSSLPYWALPGGVIEAGETIVEALVREVFEQTGLLLSDPGSLLSVVQIERSLGGQVEAGVLPRPGDSAIVFLFKARDWEGGAHPDDADGYTSQAEFVPGREAIKRLRLIPWRSTREPILSFLQGEIEAGAVWSYRMGIDGQETLVPPGPIGGR